MAVKIDLEKVHKNLRCEFIQDTSLDTKFSNCLVEGIMNCISMATMWVLWSFAPLDEFCLDKGIKHGDSLSPYIFVMCLENLGQVVKKTVDLGAWKQIKYV